MNIARAISLFLSWLVWSSLTLFVLYTIYITYTFDFDEPPRYKWYSIYTRAYAWTFAGLAIVMIIRLAYYGLLRLLRSSPKRDLVAYIFLPIITFLIVFFCFVILSVGIDVVYYGSGYFWYFAYFPAAALIGLAFHSPNSLLPKDLRKP